MDLSVALSFLFLVYIVLKMGKRSKNSDRSLNLPPGPWKLPIIGNLHQLYGSNLLHRRLTDLAKVYGPLMYLQMGEIPTIFVSSSEYVKEVLKTNDVNFASRPESIAGKIVTYDSSDIAVAPYGDSWRQIRKITVTELLSQQKVQSFGSVREEELSNLINWMASKAGTVINLTDKVHSLMYGITSKAAFGRECKDQEVFISAMKELIKVLAGSPIADLFPSIKFLESISGFKSRLEKTHQQVDKIVSNIIDEHKRRKATLKTSKKEEDEDLMDVFLKLQEHGNLKFPVTAENIKGVIFDIFAAGSDTVATTIDWTLSEMMKNPRVLKKAQTEVREVFNRKGKIDEMAISEMQYLKLVIRETLRLHQPTPLFFPRECKERCKINGYDIPAKARVHINVWAMGRDAECWREPDSFIPERFLDCSKDNNTGNNFEYIPFGYGKRMCPGVWYTKANMELTLAVLLCQFDWKLPNGMKHEDLNMTEAFGLAVRRKDDLCIIPIPYHPSPIA